MLDFLTTIPGLLIACGVIILVIAIILFILGSKGSNKTKASVNMQNNLGNDMNVGGQMPVMEPVVDTTTGLNIETTQPVMQAEAPNVQPIIEPVQTPVVEPAVEVPVQPTIDIPQPVVEPAVEVPVQPVAEENPANTIYGGETPTYNFEIPEEKPVSIYGGNDPMEATQVLPKVEEVHQPYGGADVQPVVEPAVEVPVQPAVEEVSVPVVDMPQPSVEPVQAPVVEPIAEIPVQSVVEEASSPVVDIPQPTVEPVQAPVVEPIAEISVQPTVEVNATPDLGMPNNTPVINIPDEDEVEQL